MERLHKQNLGKNEEFWNNAYAKANYYDRQLEWVHGRIVESYKIKGFPDSRHYCNMPVKYSVRHENLKKTILGYQGENEPRHCIFCQKELELEWSNSWQYLGDIYYKVKNDTDKCCRECLTEENLATIKRKRPKIN